MKRLTEAQSELIDAFLAEHSSRVSTAQLEKDLLISDVFSVFAQPIVYQGHEAAFVLCGGTAVSKAHRYTQRVSEDVDLRVVVPSGLSRSAEKRLLSHAKAEVLNGLREQGYDVPADSVKAGNENRYIAIPLKYASLYPLDQALRPELLIEISARTPILTPVICGYDTLINEALGRANRTNTIACLHIRETIAGKNAALLRRWSARLRGVERVFELGNSRDEDIVRHIYDLACIFRHFPQEKTEREAGRVARQILLQDAEEFGGQDPGFGDAPIKRAREALADLETSAEARQWYERFTTAMVYGDIPPFDEAVRGIAAFSDAWNAAGR
jgi:hypothetical protein